MFITQHLLFPQLSPKSIHAMGDENQQNRGEETAQHRPTPSAHFWHHLPMCESLPVHLVRKGREGAPWLKTRPGKGPNPLLSFLLTAGPTAPQCRTALPGPCSPPSQYLCCRANLGGLEAQAVPAGGQSLLGTWHRTSIGGHD